MNFIQKSIFITVMFLMIVSCGNDKKEVSGPPTVKKVDPEMTIKEGKGIGEIKHVELNDPLDPEMVKRGKSIYELKCAACHKLSGARVVGPSWAGITTRRKPEWILNMITNVDMMLEKDPSAQKLLEECLTRMPNQNVSIGDARDLLEFMYQNDADNAGK